MDERLQKLIDALKNLLEREQLLQAATRDFSQRAGRAKVEELPGIVKEFAASLTNELAEELKAKQEALQLAEALQTGADQGSARPHDIAQQFRSVIDQIQDDARRPGAGELATTLKSLDVELKGLIVVERDEARIVTPGAGRTIDANQLSTIRMSFGSIPVVRAPQTQPPTQPTTPPATQPRTQPTTGSSAAPPAGERPPSTRRRPSKPE